MFSRVFSIFGFLSVLVLAGCGGEGATGAAARVDVFEVSGTVTFAGAPVANASVTFSPQDGQPPALGITDSMGNYTLSTYEAGDGAAAGQFVVLVTKSGRKKSDEPEHSEDGSGDGAEPTHDADDDAAGDTLLPPRYSAAADSDISVTVKEEENQIDIQLNP